jgi:hypothetical protein
MIYPGGAGIMLLVGFLIVLMVALYYAIQGAIYFYKKWKYPEIYIEKKKSLVLKITYILAIFLLFTSAISYFYLEKEDQEERKKMFSLSTEDTFIDGHMVPIGSHVRYGFTRPGKKQDKNKYRSITYYKPYMYEGIEIDKIERWGRKYVITLSKRQTISGFYCDRSKSITIDKEGMLLKCTLDKHNIFEGIELPSGINVEHRSKYTNGETKNIEHTWLVRTFDVTFYNEVYRFLEFVINDKEKIVTFEGEKKPMPLDKNEIKKLLLAE